MYLLKSSQYELSKALIVKGHFHWFQDQFPAALTYYQEAVHLSRRYGYKQREYTALLKSSNCFDKMGDKLQKCDCLEEMHRLQNELFIISEVEIYEA
ncbi:hypothetical protein [Thermoactinomyces sp. DSM 45892]|uniref:hypothetical protein n=1 Tax=Thermoactinomyces sp. DSM 45892 TaxID=1882753 RepID=UPI00089A2128|nr:hypothetical protein [Thermoactinomyces sp. DSM 45892]SDY30966.1 hypothetical protein SAMN05444416_103238 [Thermoactinomyces sp. DSM 45892]